MYTIKVKNTDFEGERCNVGFVNGVGMAKNLTPEQLKFFKSVGYEVTGTAEKEEKLEVEKDSKKGK